MSTQREHNISSTPHSQGGPDTALGSLLQRLVKDAQTLTRDELTLAKQELIATSERAAASLATLLLGGVLTLFSLGLLCVTVVVALQPLIAALWLRMLIMSLVYFAIGALAVAVCTAWLAGTSTLLPKTRAQAEKTLNAVNDEVQHAR